MKYFFLVLIVLFSFQIGWSELLISRDQAFEKVFPNSKIVKKNHFLSEKEKNSIQKLARSKVSSDLVDYYVAYQQNQIKGYLLIDTHLVRTKSQTLLIVLSPNGTVRKLLTLAFHEPQDYRVPIRWLNLFENQNLTDSLWMKQDIDAVSGSTLTSWAVLKSVRRALAIYQVLLR